MYLANEVMCLVIINTVVITFAHLQTKTRENKGCLQQVIILVWLFHSHACEGAVTQNSDI